MRHTSSARALKLIRGTCQGLSDTWWSSLDPSDFWQSFGDGDMPVKGSGCAFSQSYHCFLEIAKATEQLMSLPANHVCYFLPSLKFGLKPLESHQVAKIPHFASDMME